MWRISEDLEEKNVGGILILIFSNLVVLTNLDSDTIFEGPSSKAYIHLWYFNCNNK